MKKTKKEKDILEGSEEVEIDAYGQIVSKKYGVLKLKPQTFY